MPVTFDGIGLLSPHTDEQAKKALGLYAVADYSATDFLDTMYEVMVTTVLHVLYLLVSTHNPKQSERNQKTNRLVTPLVEATLASRRVKVR